jgi:hypothetical protein
MRRILVLAVIMLVGGTSSQAATVETATEEPANVRLARPGPMHKFLQPTIGDWNVRMSYFPGPGKPPVVSDDMTAKRRWINGGRYVEEVIRGTLAGGDYLRYGWTTYNNLDQRWELVTQDNVGPGLMNYRSGNGPDEANPAGGFTVRGSFTFAGTGAEVVGEAMELRYVWRIEGPDRLVGTLYTDGASGAEPQERAVAEHVYTRRR